MPGREMLLFTLALLRSPRQVGAIAPSSPALGDRLAAVVPRRDDAVIVELGAGTGAVTGRIDSRRSPSSTFLAFERNSRLAATVRLRFPGVRVVSDDVRCLAAHLSAYGIAGVDAIVCGLPWANFSPREHDELLDDIAGVLASGGVFTTFAYVHALMLPQARAFRDALSARFDEVLPTRTVLRNVPPAITYVCRAPRR